MVDYRIRLTNRLMTKINEYINELKFPTPNKEGGK